jgi:hypothetical protein
VSWNGDLDETPWRGDRVHALTLSARIRVRSRGHDSKVKAATGQVEQGAKKIPKGKVGEGVKQTAKGVGKTVTEGAKYSGQKVKEAVK